MRSNVLPIIGLASFAGVLALPLAGQLLYLTTFRDVPESHPLYAAIEELADRGIVSGYADGTFRADADINRAEFVKIVVGAVATKSEIESCLELKSFQMSRLADVNPTDWYASFLCAARSRGMVSGYPNGTFGGGLPINAAEAAKIMVNAMRPAQLRAQTATEGEAWYLPSFAVLANEQAIPLSISTPEQSLTRGEMADILYRLFAPRGKPSRTLEDFTSEWATTIMEAYGVTLSYPRSAPLPPFDAQGGFTDSAVFPARSLWRVYLGAKLYCPPEDAACAPYEWMADGFSREAGDAAATMIASDNGTITVISDVRDTGKRTIVYTEKRACTHRAALVLGPASAVRLLWQCGEDKTDGASFTAFHEMVDRMRFFEFTSSVSSSQRSVSSNPVSSASSATSESSVSSASSASSVSSEPSASSSRRNSSRLSSSKQSSSKKSAVFWWSKQSSKKTGGPFGGT